MKIINISIEGGKEFVIKLKKEIFGMKQIIMFDTKYRLQVQNIIYGNNYNLKYSEKMEYLYYLIYHKIKLQGLKYPMYPYFIRKVKLENRGKIFIIYKKLTEKQKQNIWLEFNKGVIII